MRRPGYAFRGSKRRNHCPAGLSVGRWKSIRKSRDIRCDLAKRGQRAPPLQRKREAAGERKLNQGETQISAEADVNDLPKSKRSLAGDGCGTPITRFG